MVIACSAVLIVVGFLLGLLGIYLELVAMVGLAGYIAGVGTILFALGAHGARITHDGARLGS